MQLMKKTAKSVAAKHKVGTVDYTSPAGNIEIASYYLHDLFRHYQKRPAYVAGSYNAGEAVIDYWLKNRDLGSPLLNVEFFSFSETQNYVKKVLTNLAIYEFLLGNHNRS